MISENGTKCFMLPCLGCNSIHIFLFLSFFPNPYSSSLCVCVCLFASIALFLFFSAFVVCFLFYACFFNFNLFFTSPSHFVIRLLSFFFFLLLKTFVPFIIYTPFLCSFSIIRLILFFLPV